VIDIERRHIYPEFKRGKKVYYFRIGHGRRIRIREEPGTEEFDRRYHELLRQAQAGELRQELRGTSEHGVAKAGTWRWLAQAYMASAEFRALDPGGTQRPRWLILERTFKEPRAPGAKELFADCPLDLFTRKTVKILHNRIADTPDAANARLQAIRAVFRWALDNEVGGLTVNPARDVKRLPPKRQGGWPTWSQEEVEKFHARHPRGTKARVAFDLLRFTGVRRSDVILLGRQHIKDGALSILAFKGRNRFPVQVDTCPSCPNFVLRSTRGLWAICCSWYRTTASPSWRMASAAGSKNSVLRLGSRTAHRMASARWQRSWLPRTAPPRTSSGPCSAGRRWRSRSATQRRPAASAWRSVPPASWQAR
jgi:integrase